MSGAITHVVRLNAGGVPVEFAVYLFKRRVTGVDFQGMRAVAPGAYLAAADRLRDHLALVDILVKRLTPQEFDQVIGAVPHLEDAWAQLLKGVNAALVSAAAWAVA